MSVSNSKAMWLTCACFLMVAPQVTAQSVSDPTQPPNAAIATPAGGTVIRPVSTAPQLQSILISTRYGGRQVAVINGKTVRMGDKYGGAVLIKMTPTTVVLRRGTQLQTLKLYPEPTPRVGNGVNR